MLGIERSELGGCRLIRRIGEGAMGEVYLAEQISLGNRLVAVKVVREEHDITPPPPDAPEGARWHFVREAALLGQLTHPNILPVYHSGTEAGYLFLVMQYAPDGSLADAIKGKGPHSLNLPASVPIVADIVAQLAGALQYTHEHHVIHADVKPSNVLVQVEPNGHWHMLLADFGVARSMDSLALRDEVAGTAAYMAPEQFFGQLSPACDQYALGVMAFQLLTGRLPFTGGLIELVNAHARDDPPALHDLNAAVSASVEAVILRALEKQPEDRYRSVADFAQALRAAATGSNTTVVAPNYSGVDWAGAGLAIRKRDATARTAPASPWLEPSSPPDTFPETVPIAAYPAGESQANRRTPDGNGRRRIAPGLAVLALLLVSGIAGLSLRSHIDISRASSWLGGASNAPTAPDAGVSASPGSSPTTAPTTVPSAPGGGGPVIIWPTNAPTAQPTPASSPAPTATPTGEPTATTPSPTATPATVPSPTDTPTVAPSPGATPTRVPLPTATATAQPTEPAPTATPPSGPAEAPSATQPAQTAPDAHLPASAPGTP